LGRAGKPIDQLPTVGGDIVRVLTQNNSLFY
jgi:hypothetical protein